MNLRQDYNLGYNKITMRITLDYNRWDLDNNTILSTLESD